MGRLSYIVLCALLVLSLFAGCQRDVSQAKIVRYDMPGKVTNLDPQFATDEFARMIIANIFEGLYKYDGDGALVYGLAESCDTSSDGLTMTFDIKKDAKWQDGTDITAENFVFAFRRIFSNSQPSPFAGDYIAIENAREIMEGKAGADKLGVKAINSKKLEIKLAHKSPYFPECLAGTPAMPCDQAIFDESKGRYGLEMKYVNAGGAFQLERWDDENSMIYLRKNAKYYDAKSIVIDGVNLYVSDADPFDRLSEGSSDFAAVTEQQAKTLEDEGFEATYFESTVWCIVFNQNSDLWANPLLRQGLAHAADRSSLSGIMPDNYAVTQVLFPPSVTLAGENYYKNVKTDAVKFDAATARRLFDMAISASGVEGSLSASMNVPDSSQHLLAMGALQKGWQENLSAYISVEPEPAQDIAARFYSGDYDMLLMPISAQTPDAKNMFSMFTSNYHYNKFGYQNGLYDGIVDEISDADDLAKAAQLCGRAESILLQDAVIIPVYVEKIAFAVSPSAKGLRGTPFPDRLRFQYLGTS